MSYSEDLSIDGPGSPVSLKKFIESSIRKNDLTILVENDNGIALDDPHTLYMTPQDRFEQTSYFLQHHFDGKTIPAYLFRYLRYMYISDDDKYKSNQDVEAALKSNELNNENHEFKTVLNLIKYS